MASSVNYSCPNCSAPLVFQPGKDTVTCEYCGNEFSVATIEELFSQKEQAAANERKAQEKKWDTEAAGGEWSDEDAANLRAFTCSACGAQIVADQNTMATECCYCGNPTMLPARFEGQLKPDFVIPFQKTKEDAVAALKNFYKGKFLLPNDFTANNRVEAIQPMYVPFWLFDAKGIGDATFTAEKVRHYQTSDENVKETKVYRCRREGSMRFEKIPADGSRKMPDDYMDSIEPFDYGQMVPFTTAYLTGFLADKYDVTAGECAARADKRMETTVVDELKSTVTGYTSVTTDSASVIKADDKVVYAMMPVWILSTKYKGEVYTFMMNGQTGKVAGTLPYSFIKSILYPTIVAMILFPVFLFLVPLIINGGE